MFLAIQKNIDFYNEFYVHFVCEFFIVSNYNEMNCKLFLELFSMYSKMSILVICNNHEFDVVMNGSVKFVET
jgi:hypothetical protein